MSENTKIQWATHSFSPWRGCSKISPGCENCYAAAGSKRNPGTLGVWGPNGTRVVAAEASWRRVMKWDRDARKAGERHRVFPSLCDPFEDWTGPMVAASKKRVYLGKHFGASRGPNDRLTMDDVRARLFSAIDDTTNLDWLILSKRPENIAKMTPSRAATEPVFLGFPGRLGQPLRCEIYGPRTNVWLGVSVENQERADKLIRLLLQTPAAVRFLSCEPLLGPINFGNAIFPRLSQMRGAFRADYEPQSAGIDWVIVGGESGPGARPCQIDWIRDIVRQCRAAGVPCFVKQLGALPMLGDNDTGNDWPAETRFGNRTGEARWNGRQILLDDKKGGDIMEWPEDLQVREFPETSQCTK